MTHTQISPLHFTVTNDQKHQRNNKEKSRVHKVQKQRERNDTLLLVAMPFAPSKARSAPSSVLATSSDALLFHMV